MKNIKGKKILIIGLGVSGFAAALLAKKKKARVFVSDESKNKAAKDKAGILRKKDIFVELGGHSASFFERADLVIISPGVKNNAQPLIWAKDNNVPIISEIEFASWFCAVPIVAITGTNGKTTVTTLIGKVFKDAGKRVAVCGNIGNSFSKVMLHPKNADVVVLEVSSFQLQYTQNFRPKVSIILNVSRNHLDHHATMDEYFEAKAKIVSNQKADDFAILNFDDPKVRRLSKKTQAKIFFFGKNKKDYAVYRNVYGACWLEDRTITGEWKNKTIKFLSQEQLKLKGMHNLENVMAVILAAKAQSISNDNLIKTLKGFKGLHHRCQRITSIKSIDFFNDSKSTTVDATSKALAMFSKKSVLLICGGRDKGSDFRPLGKLVRDKVLLVILIGEAAKKINQAWIGHVLIKVVPTLKAAVRLAYSRAKKGNSVLLSPMCASFDMFKSYKHRGEVFVKEVKSLKLQVSSHKQKQK
ncbi:MAG: UDP-N-acetylmuramoyl-L-alanine--D-glutamate ligase [Candidatus Omnitrophota bacterium]